MRAHPGGVKGPDTNFLPQNRTRQKIGGSDEMSSESTTDYPLGSVANALRILLMLRDRDAVGVSEAARELMVAPSTAHRLLGTLVQFGFVEREGKSRRYKAGRAMVGIGLSALRHLDFRAAARPHLLELVERVDETVNLMALEGASIRFLECIECGQALRIVSRVGLTRPVTTTSVGKALLAELSADELNRLVPWGRPLPGLTERSISDRAVLERELETVREQGFATNFGEADLSISAIGVSIKEPSGRANFGIAVSVPSSRMNDGRVKEIARAAMASARQIERSLRSGEPTDPLPQEATRESKII